MINLTIGELYGTKSVDELMSTIQDLRKMGMSDEEIQKILERSKQEKKDG